MDAGLFPKATGEEVRRLQRAEFWPEGAALRSPVNAFAVNSGGRLWLIDTGSADTFGPGAPAGWLPRSLAAAGLAPGQVDDIFLTHMHPDHLGGLLGPDGAPAFPNAAVHVHRDDWAFWMSADNRARATGPAAFWFAVAQERAGPVRDRIVLHGAGDDLGAGLSVVDAAGHTPGHAGVLVGDGGAGLLILGDIVHAALLQFAHPDWTLAFDIDQDAAHAARARLLDMAAADRIPLAGMHIPFPGIGWADRAGTGYRFVPARWAYTL
jgi:glyoxylase-like metal-dependent hydrolase (beta-lactamase superfamily II)